MSFARPNCWIWTPPVDLRMYQFVSDGLKTAASNLPSPSKSAGTGLSVVRHISRRKQVVTHKEERFDLDAAGRFENVPRRVRRSEDRSIQLAVAVEIGRDRLVRRVAERKCVECRIFAAQNEPISRRW